MVQVLDDADDYAERNKLVKESRGEDCRAGDCFVHV
jgi:hypothetical protein